MTMSKTYQTPEETIYET